jgi:hypothetical protein
VPAKATDKDLDNRLKHNRTVLFNRRMHQPAARGAIFTVATTFPGQCPLVLLVKVGWRQGKALGNEYDKFTENDCWEYASKKKIRRSWMMIQTRCQALKNRCYVSYYK